MYYLVSGTRETDQVGFPSMVGPGSPTELRDPDRGALAIVAPGWGISVGARRLFFRCVASSFSLSLAAPGSRLPRTLPLIDEAALRCPG